MANLIIKPSAGGDLKLQDEGSTDAITISTTGNTTLAGTANNLGTVTAGAIPSSLVTGNRLIQHQYAFKASGVDFATSSSNTNTISGSPFKIITPAFDTTSTASTIWRVSTGVTANNETGANGWCASMKVWVSYDGGSNYTINMGSGANAVAGNYMSYGSGPTDEYVLISSTLYLTLTASQSNTKIGTAFFSQESDNTRWNLLDGAGCWLEADQYLVP
jgi:hypothetical protein